MTGNELKHRAVLVRELAPTPLVLADDGRLAQVLVNLLINAAHAIPEAEGAARVPTSVPVTTLPPPAPDPDPTIAKLRRAPRRRRLTTMRAGLLALVAFACGPKPSTTPRPFDNDLDTRAPSAEPADPISAPRPVAPPGKGLRAGTIARAHLLAVLDAGPATFLRQLEVAPRLAGEKFIGWQLVQLLDRTGPLHDVDLIPGDVLLAINGKSLSRPEQLQTMWDSLRTANEVTAQMWRGEQKLELHFVIDPPIR